MQLDVTATLRTLFSELIDGPPAPPAFMLNLGDVGLLRSLDRLSAADASAPTSTGSTIAAHVDHLRYGLSLMNGWTPGTNPWRNADWTASWKRTTVSEPEWRALRDGLRDESRRWLESLQQPRDLDTLMLNIMLGNVAHVAYHVGAIRQIAQGARGPTAEEELPLKRGHPEERSDEGSLSVARS